MDGRPLNSISRRAACQFMAAGLGMLLTGGCLKVAALSSKVFLGDPKAMAKLKSTSGVDLEDETHRVILTCHAPLSVQDGFESVAGDLEVELLRRMRQKKIPVVDPNEIVELIDARGGRYNSQVLIDEIRDANVLFELRIENFSLKEPNTPQMYHGKCSGQIVGFQIEGINDASDETTDTSPRRMARFFEHEFDVDYPNGHPVPRENMSETIFRKKFIAFLGQRLGNVFFDVTSQELYS